MFKALGILLAAYTAVAIMRGEVFAKDGVRWQMVGRADSPRYFWIVVGIYAGLSLALVTVF